MVNINDIEDSFRKFRSEFWEDVVEINVEGKENLEEVKERMMESEYFKMVKRFAEERGWKIANEGLTLMIEKKEKGLLELPLVSVTNDNKMIIQSWSRVMEKLEKVED